MKLNYDRNRFYLIFYGLIITTKRVKGNNPGSFNMPRLAKDIKAQ